jgi:hypothetical protein
MDQLGAWVAFNLDGGGSSQLWADGYRNDYDGNNNGSGLRSVANHWGVFAGAVDFLPDRPGHCAAAPVCATLPRDGGALDDAGPCFRGFGDPDYWRDEAAGEGGGLHWTNAFESDATDNWAWWRLELAEGGDYLVEVSTDAAWSVRSDVRYEVMADGAAHEVRIDPRGGGWKPLGTFRFAAGGAQWVAVFDNEPGGVASGQHIVADAVRLTRVGPDDPEDTGVPDTGTPDTGTPDTGAPDTGAPDTGVPDSGTAGGDDTAGAGGSALVPGERVRLPLGCGCDAGAGGARSGAALVALGLLVAARRGVSRSGPARAPAPRGGARRGPR